MKALLANFTGRLERRSSAGVICLGLLYETALGIIDFHAPSSMNVTLLYLLGIAFVGWGAGKQGAILVSLFSAGIIVVNNLAALRRAEQPVWSTVWNAVTGFLVFWGMGWLTAEVTRLTGHLSHLVERRTAEWKAEADQHRETAGRLAEREGQLLEISDREQARIGRDTPGRPGRATGAENRG